MEAGTKNSVKKQGVSIITCTNRQGFLKNLFNNYSRQHYPKKELIIVVNNNKIPLAPYQHLAKRLRNVRIYRVPERFSLGACLNYAVNKSKYSYIAKFDDDDYYARYYLTEALQVFQRTNADVIGKRAHYMYLRGSKTLILRFPPDENRSVASLPGATLVIKRSVFNQVHFPDQSVGEDDRFCITSRRKGYKVYSAGRYNFVAIRRKNSSNHTWIISDKELIAHHKTIPNVKNYKKWVQRKPKGVLYLKS
ncbi:glycosyltransferase family 2 protein [Paenibacillus sonchi]|uniref:Glycosyltransferase family 2 protein n=1 Tax=Paenibacillus sonchi TaxID=373687 RepID=A0A974SE35_9BACL|nr:glycosyltransferase family 2 protein [Paenibacillus sonchi]MCE3204033.1 glycosyltransferase family 2 protein [Paenibacillus sonchi]QQZ62517.1 glycosyltransferase family 2 protein [Paenibacillus sonchi]